MTQFIAVKVHYDHRSSLPSHLKYSRAPTLEEYQEYLALYREQGIGGEGFHECLNFSIPDERAVRIYLPPTCIPDGKLLNEDFIIFSFTYKYDREMPARIVGVHAGTRILNRAGIARPDIEELEGLDPFLFHAEAPADEVTLITPPIEYDYREGRFTPPYKSWGYGLRYITEEHAKNIITASLVNAQAQLPLANSSKQLVIERQIAVLEGIYSKYLTNVREQFRPVQYNTPPLPDKELGHLGEKLVYEKEVAYAKSIGAPTSEVEWISQSVPTSPFDIRTVRKTPEGFRDHFIEVKSSKIQNEENVYVSARQVAFFQAMADDASFVFVTFDSNRNQTRIRELSFEQLQHEFELVPIKYTLRHKPSNKT